jgi:ABC-type sulfate transport system permease component
MEEYKFMTNKTGIAVAAAFVGVAIVCMKIVERELKELEEFDFFSPSNFVDSKGRKWD